MTHIAVRAYIEPFRSWARAKTYIATMLGVFGYSIAALVFSYSLAGVGLRDLGVFWGLWCGLIGALMPCLCYAYTTGGRRRAIWLFPMMTAAGLTPFLLHGAVGGAAPVWLAIGFAATSVPFWTAYHLAMLLHGSDENRGHEVSIAYVIMAFSGFFSSLAGGALMSANLVMPAIGLSFAFMSVGMLLLLTMLPERGLRVPAYWRVYAEQITRTDGLLLLLTLASGIITIFTGTLLPSWMNLKGVGPMGTGGVLAAQVALRFVFSPFAGSLVHAAKGGGLFAGVLLYGVGGLVLLLPFPVPVCVLAASFVWVFAGQLLMCGLDKRWYDRATVVALGAHESVLNMGRLIGLVPAILLLAIGPDAFVPGYLVIVAILAVATLWSIKRQRNSAAKLTAG